MASHISANPPVIRNSRLWLGWWLGALTWMGNLLVSFALVDWYCHNDLDWSIRGATLALHGLTLAALMLTLLSFGLARRAYKHLRASDQATARSIFIARSGCWASLFFAVAVTIQGWSNFLVELCI